MQKYETTRQQQQILNLMKESRIYWQARKQTIHGIKKSDKKPTPQQILTQLSSSNKEKIIGLINNCLQKSTKRVPIQTDPNPQISVYRTKWSQLIVKQFNNISGKISREEQFDEQDQSVAYIYDPMSLLQFLASIKTKTAIKVRDSICFMFPQDTLRVQKYQQIRTKYSFLLFQDNLIGGGFDQDTRQRQKKAKRISDGQEISSQIQHFLCFGCVNGERISVYKRYFQCFYEYSGKRIEYNLIQKVWKPLIRADCSNILNNQQYFVFKEQIVKTFKIFVCDKQLGQMVKIKQLSQKQTNLEKYSPIHQIIPCKSFSSYIAPFCYTAIDVQQVYQIFRQVYANYFVLLNTVSSLPDSILSLCMIFEDLLWQTQRKIVTKLQNLCIQPLRIVFPWIFYCFIGYVQVQQFYLLLDRIIGSKSLQILPLYCVSIFFKEKTSILQAKSQNQIHELLEDSLKQDTFIETIRQYFKYHL